MSNNRKRVYWDANCFIALLNRQSTVKAEYLDAIETAYDEMMAGGITIVTSKDLFKGEVFGPDNATAATQVYNDLLACRFLDMYPMPYDAYDLAGKLRQDLQGVGQSMKLPHARIR